MRFLRLACLVAACAGCAATLPVQDQISREDECLAYVEAALARSDGTGRAAFNATPEARDHWAREVARENTVSILAPSSRQALEAEVKAVVEGDHGRFFEAVVSCMREVPREV